MMAIVLIVNAFSSSCCCSVEIVRNSREAASEAVTILFQAISLIIVSGLPLFAIFLSKEAKDFCYSAIVREYFLL